MSQSPKRKLLIDTDGGLDDANALMLALSSPNVEVVAITTVCGNVNEHQAALNVLRLLKVAEKIEIPVYKGATKSLIGNTRKSVSHGSDGFGDSPDVSAPGPELIKSEHAVEMLLKLVNENPGLYELVCLGPLTNIALAIRLDPDFGSKLSKCWVMGGNYQGVGNTTPAAEFNFCCDPEAAFVVLHELGINITLVCWETCVRYEFDWETYDSIRTNPTKKNIFLKQIENKIVSTRKEKGLTSYILSDLIAMTVVMDKSIVTSSFDTYCRVEISGSDTRGAMIINRRNYYNHPDNVTIVTEIKRHEIIEMMKAAIK